MYGTYKNVIVYLTLLLMFYTLFSQRGHRGRLRAALLHPLNHHREITLCLAAAFKKKKNTAPSPLKLKQLQTPNVYWETCASHQTKSQSLYPAGLQGVIDHELLHTYMSFSVRC